MFAVMVPVFAVGPSLITTYLLAGAVLAVALSSTLPAVPQRLVKVAAIALGAAVIANAMVPCQYWWFCLNG